MKHRSRPEEQDDLLRPRLVDMIDMRHELVKLADLIDWEFFDREWAGFFPSATGRPATPPRLVAGLMYLQHAYRLSDEAVIARWVDSPYVQHFTGETFFQHQLPIHPSSLSRWRDRIGEEGAEWLLTKTIQAGRVCRYHRRQPGARLRRHHCDGKEYRVSNPLPAASCGCACRAMDARLYEKARVRYEFGCKVSLATTIDGGFVVGMRAMPGNPNDGHTLAEALEQVETLTDRRPDLAARSGLATQKFRSLSSC
ncbi:Transposase domain (DUF772) [Puniceibacterium sp. IMCC21224]|nr:Transposase domain (DUF772) [Puniceibacterium sp. IMCC21224]